MRGNVGGKNRSLFSRIRLIAIVLVIGTSLIFALLTYLQKEIFEKFDECIKINTALENISVGLLDNWQAFNDYRNTMDPVSSQKLRTSADQLDEGLAFIRRYSERSADSAFYYRTFHNMSDTYKDYTSGLLSTSKFDETGYERLMFLSQLVQYMNQQSNKMSMSFLNDSNHEYYRSLRFYQSIKIKIYIAMALIFLCCLAYAMGVGANIVIVMRKLGKYAAELSGAHWEIPDIESQKYAELDQLARTFNTMKNNIREFIEKLNREAEIESKYAQEKLKNAENDELLKEIQLTALQSQMNPHFLFNTLNIISRTAMFEGAGETVRLVQATSKILRYNLSRKHRLVALQEELDMVHFYLLIQETRFQDRICFQVNVEDTIGDVRIPPMTIQPIVENAIVHGLREKDAGGVIRLHVGRREDVCEIRVEDNGIGMTPEEVRLILSGGKPSSIGISNIKKRLELNFGLEEPLQIHSRAGEGTTVVIRVPVAAGDNPEAPSELSPMDKEKTVRADA